MADQLMLEIVTPEKLAFSDVVEEVTLSGSEGEFGVLIGHAPLLSSIKFGELNYTKDSKKTYWFAGDGYAEITNLKATVLVESIEEAKSIIGEEAQKTRESVEAQLAGMDKDDPDYERVKKTLGRAEARLKVAEKV
ncbi:MAG: ATP synthase F1 subunit epsilon [Deltaproteobacteria bacterium]|nr:ATP synthase F1 subunit epsilon [Deltaproteobacteria bacterium]MBW2594699.1 ATP synthase F1 subunit epsilon [Deltaproteobacteria bacterium]MBW2649526.1 ATP synthase F1 subunit epsilon [Deltaproteobacteria bacterium]